MAFHCTLNLEKEKYSLSVAIKVMSYEDDNLLSLCLCGMSKG